MTASESHRAILDTSVVIGPRPASIPGEIAISAATVAELHFGVLVAQTASVRAERLRRLSVVQRNFDAVPIDDSVATSYGSLAAAVADAERRPRTMSLLIAATAHAHEATLYTHNPDDFAGLEDLVHVVGV